MLKNLGLSFVLFLGLTRPCLSEIQICTEKISVEDSVTFRFASVMSLDCLWTRPDNFPRVLKVKFLDGNLKIKTRVEEIARTWSDYAGIYFDFDYSNNSQEADIRISFRPEGSWSYIGRCGPHDQNLPTMNFGWLTEDLSDAAFQRVVLHEFGHALGLRHEHQNPAANIPWNREAVYAYYSTTQSWDKDDVDNFVLNPAQGEIRYSSFDRESIMLYAIPKELTYNDFSVPWNTSLSQMDKDSISLIYPDSLRDALRESISRRTCGLSWLFFNW
jgi:serralysin